jgi:hypothetical protein
MRDNYILFLYSTHMKGFAIYHKTTPHTLFTVFYSTYTYITQSRTKSTKGINESSYLRCNFTTMHVMSSTIGESFSHLLLANLQIVLEASVGFHFLDLLLKFCTICTAWLLSMTSHTPSVAIIMNSSYSSTMCSRVSGSVFRDV